MAAKEQPKDPKALPAAGEGEEPPKKKSKVKLLIILLIVLLLIGGAGGAVWWKLDLIKGLLGLEVAPVVTTEGDTPPEGAATESTDKAPDVSTEGMQRIERPSNLPRSTGQVLPLPEFVVNLSDPAGKRYLKLGMEVEVNADVSAALKNQAPKIRDSVIMLLAGKTFEEVSSAEGKVLLKAEVAARLNQILGGAYVVRVYFTEFVVQ